MTATAPRIDGTRLWRALMDLARIGATPRGGVCRLAPPPSCERPQTDQRTAQQQQRTRFRHLGNDCLAAVDQPAARGKVAARPQCKRERAGGGKRAGCVKAERLGRKRGSIKPRRCEQNARCVVGGICALIVGRIAIEIQRQSGPYRTLSRTAAAGGEARDRTQKVGTADRHRNGYGKGVVVDDLKAR